MSQIGKPYVQWLKKQRVRTEIYRLSITSEVSEGIESIAKTPSIGDDEEVGSRCNSIETELTQMRSTKR